MNRKPRHHGAILYNNADLLVYSLGRVYPGPDDDDEEEEEDYDEQWCRTVLCSRSRPARMSGSSVCLDGRIYLLADHSRVLAFDADDETVTAIDLPGERAPGDEKHAKSRLMEMSGRLCAATACGRGG